MSTPYTVVGVMIPRPDSLFRFDPTHTDATVLITLIKSFELLLSGFILLSVQLRITDSNLTASIKTTEECCQSGSRGAV